ncbi:MAG: hypothetical protein Q7T37_01850 [bacterium]|nr:hypothetical protein [bacterium]MDO8742775.1 hypothetical protein [bacterium]
MTREERNAKRLEEICGTINKNGGNITAENTRERLAQLRTLCALIPGTPALQEYILELLDTGELQPGGVLEFFFIKAGKGEFGVYIPPVAREFERLLLLFELPSKMHQTLRRRSKKSKKEARRLFRKITRWTRQFTDKYGPVDQGANKEAVLRHLKYLNESEANETWGSLSS